MIEVKHVFQRIGELIAAGQMEWHVIHRQKPPLDQGETRGMAGFKPATDAQTNATASTDDIRCIMGLLKGSG